MAKKGITKYFFNGVLLPPLPNWNASAYPYAVIRTQFDSSDSPMFYFYAFSKRPSMKVVDGSLCFTCSSTCKVIFTIKFPAVDFWIDDPYDMDMSEYAGYDWVYWYPDSTLHVWCNFNIYDEDGVCVHPATNYEQKREEPVDHSDFIKGLQIGISLHGVLHIKTHWQPTEFTLEAAKWNGTTYTVSLSGYKVVDPPQVGLPMNSTYHNTIRVVDASLTIPEASGSSVVISARKIPTEDIKVSIWGLEAVDTAVVEEVAEVIENE